MDGADGLSGAKGVLTHCPEKAGPHEIRLRPSTIKFESDLTQLNAVRVSASHLSTMAMMLMSGSWPSTRSRS